VIVAEVGDLGKVIRARKPTAPARRDDPREVKTVLANLTGVKWLMASLMYGAGLRLMECLRLRVQDLDFSATRFLFARQGSKDRITMFYPRAYDPPSGTPQAGKGDPERT